MSKPQARSAPARTLRRLPLAVGCGAGVLLGLEPFGGPLFWALAPGCLYLLARDLETATWRARLFWSLIACLATSVIAFQWLVVALIDIGHLSLPLALILFFAQSPFLNLKIVLVLLGGSFVGPRTRLPGPLLFGALGLAGDLFTYQAFPWYWGNLAGGDLLLRQMASLGGVFALSFLVFFATAVLIELFANWRGRVPVPRASWLAFALVACVYGYGGLRVATADIGGETVRVAFFQPVTGRALATDRGESGFVGRALNLVFNYGLKTIAEDGGRLDLLIIPESAVPFHGTRAAPETIQHGVYSPTFLGVVAYLARFGDVDVLYNELDVIPGTPAGTRPAPLRNLATLFGREGRRRDSYWKLKLVPFGEYLPGEAALPFLRALFPEADYYRPGDSPATLTYEYRPDRARRVFTPPTPEELTLISEPDRILADWPEREGARRGSFAALVCYEGMWPDLVRGFFRGKAGAAAANSPDPDFLINITNDAWFGDYLANWQHFDAVKLRAIETNRYYVRATLTGAGGVFDPLGRDFVPRTELGRPAIRHFDLPRRPDAWSVYLSVGEVPLYILLVVTCVLGWWWRGEVK